LPSVLLLAVFLPLLLAVLVLSVLSVLSILAVQSMPVLLLPVLLLSVQLLPVLSLPTLSLPVRLEMLTLSRGLERFLRALRPVLLLLVLGLSRLIEALGLTYRPGDPKQSPVRCCRAVLVNRMDLQGAKEGSQFSPHREPIPVKELLFVDVY